MTDRELMQQALEALNHVNVQDRVQIITALRERLAQPEQCQCPECQITPHASDCAVHNEPAYPKGACNCGAQPEQSRAERMRDAGYTRRPTLREIASEDKHPEQEPVAHTLNCVCGVVWDIKADGSEEMAHTPDTTPPQRKPLTHPQIHEFDWPDGVSFEDILLFVRSVEAAHGIKVKA